MIDWGARTAPVDSDDTLLFEPGTRYLYSTYGWNLLSAVVEGASGRNFLSYMRQDVFAPLGLRQTVPDFNDSLVPFRARFYTRADSAAPALGIFLSSAAS